MQRSGQILIEVILAIFLLIWLVPKVEEWTGNSAADAQLKEAADSNHRIMGGH